MMIYYMNRYGEPSTFSLGSANGVTTTGSIIQAVDVLRGLDHKPQGFVGPGGTVALLDVRPPAQLNATGYKWMSWQGEVYGPTTLESALRGALGRMMRHYDPGNGTRLTDCCGAYSTYCETTLSCKKCYNEVSPGQGDGTETRPLGAGCVYCYGSEHGCNECLQPPPAPEWMLEEMSKWDIFEADFKGTCALCFDTIRRGDTLVRVDHEVLGSTMARNVHVECQRNLILSNDPESAELEKAAVHKVP